MSGYIGSMSKSPVTSEDELQRLLRDLREGGEKAVLSIDDLFGLDDTAAARAKADFPGNFINGVGDAVGIIPGIGEEGGKHVKKFAMNAVKNPAFQLGMRYAPVVGTALSAGDLLLSNDSIGNKAMDAAAMGVGGLIGSAFPVFGTGVGIAGGKVLSDLTQYLLGGGLSGGN